MRDVQRVPPLVIAYASRTGTRRNLAALRAAGWRLMVSARGVLRTEGFRYALDNGAWTAHQKGEPFDVAAFEKAYRELGQGADFVVVPDVVAGGLESLAFSLSWLARLDGLRLLAVQDGMWEADVAPHLGPSVGVFVGGTTQWKERTTPAWARLARVRGAYCHVGRVNTARRIAICRDAGADSIDGSSVSRFADTLRPLDNALRQQSLLGRRT
jgi:hypothetical protein